MRSLPQETGRHAAHAAGGGSQGGEEVCLSLQLSETQAQREAGLLSPEVDWVASRRELSPPLRSLHGDCGGLDRSPDCFSLPANENGQAGLVGGSMLHSLLI